MKYLSLILLFSCFVACNKPSQVENSHFFVKEGEPLDIVEDFEKLSREPGYLQGKRENNLLYANKIIGKGNVTIDITLSFHEIPKVQGKPDFPAAFVKLGSYYFWINFAEEKPDLYVLDEKGKEIQAWEVKAQNMRLEEKIQFSFHKKENELAIRWDNQLVGTLYLEEPLRGKFGVYPAKGYCRIFSFSAQGDLHPWEEVKSFIQVFARGENGYNTFRIPEVASVGKQRLLAFAEARRKSRSDFGEIDIVMKVSDNGGLTWGPMEVIAGKNDTLAFNSPCIIADKETGILHLYCNYARKEVLHYQSEDQGDSWSEGDTLELLGGDTLYPKWHFLLSPGAALLLEKGAHAGRRVLPGFYQLVVGEGVYRMHSVLAYKDPGSAWKLSEPVDTSLFQSNECIAAELGDGSLLMNIRTQDPRRRYRWHARSTDGGANWEKAVAMEDLVDPICHASMLKIPGNPDRLVFANPSNPLMYHRTHLTVRISKDMGNSWPEEQLIYEGPSAYSAMTLLDKNSLVVLFELGYNYNYERIVLEILPLPAYKP